MKEERLSIPLIVDKSIFNEIASLSNRDNRTIPNTTETIILVSLKKLSYEFINIESHKNLIKEQEKYIKFLAMHIANYKTALVIRSYEIKEENIREERRYIENIKQLKERLKPRL